MIAKESKSDKSKTRGVLSGVIDKLSGGDLAELLAFTVTLAVKGAVLSLAERFNLAALLMDGGADVPPGLIPSDLDETQTGVLAELWGRLSPKTRRNVFGSLIDNAVLHGEVSQSAGYLYNLRFARAGGDPGMFGDGEIVADCKKIGFPAPAMKGK
jgi:hypothetical protein